MRIEIHSSKVEIVIDPKIETALITGDGRSLPEDLERFLARSIPHDVHAIGRSINAYPGRVQHWWNVDGADSVWWAEHLPSKNNGKPPIRHTMGECRGYDVDWEIKDEIVWNPNEILWHGSTALFAVYGCLSLAYKKIFLAGCPLDSRGHWYFGPEHTGPRWTGESYQAWLEFARTPEAKQVESLSGYTRQILGNGWTAP